MDIQKSQLTDQSVGPSGRACGNCSRAKTKCIVGLDLDGKCERCSRLRKECNFPASVIRKRKSGKRTRVAEMEAKIDGLVTLLKSTQQPSLISESEGCKSDSSPTKIPDAPPSSSPADSLHPYAPSSQLGDRGAVSPLVQALTPDSFGAKGVPLSNILPTQESRPLFGFHPGPGEPEVFLNRFRDMATCFPFVFLPPSTSARDLLRDRPFLYHCIMAVSCRSSSYFIAFGIEVTHYIGEQMLVKGEKSLDLLLGILTYAGWHHFNGSLTTQLCVLLQLAISLVYNLGLNRPRPSRSKYQIFEHAILNPYDSGKAAYGRAREPESQTLEEQRGLIGCFFLSSMYAASSPQLSTFDPSRAPTDLYRLSTNFQQMEPLRVTPYMEECMQNLSEKAECQGDRIMVCLARLQTILEQVPSTYGVQSPASLIPVGLYVKALEGRLQAMRKDMLPEFGQNMIALLHYHSVELNVFELGLSMPDAVASTNGQDFQRLEILHAGLKATQAFFNTFLGLPAYYARNLSSITYIQVAKSMALLHKLSTFESPDWNLDYVGETMDFGSILGQLIQWFENVKAMERMEDGWFEDTEDIFYRIVRKTSRIKAWYEQRTCSSSLDPEMSTTILDSGVAVDEGCVDLLNDTWLEEMLGPWDSQYNDGCHDSI